MNEQEIANLGNIDRVELKLKLDATITIFSGGQPSEWLKPGVEGKVSWRGIPSDTEVVAGYVFLEKKLLAPMLQDLIVEYRKQLDEARRGG